MAENDLNEVRTAVSESVAKGDDIRAKVRELTLQALKNRRLDTAEVKKVMNAVTEGISLGLDRRGGEAKAILSEAVAGLDEALTKSAEAMRLALQQLTSQGKDFSEQELKQALDTMKKLEEEFVSTLSRVADAASDRVKREFKELVTHVQRAGTDTGAKVAATLNEFGNRARATVGDSAVSGKEAARETGGRLAALASGILAGLSEVLHEKSKKQ